MKHIIVGYGEVGKALHGIFPEAGVYDYESQPSEIKNHYDVLHICFPYHEQEPFAMAVEEYQRWYTPSLTIIHSSVPIGTSESLKAVHSPIRGVHPHLEKGIRTFVKYFGGVGEGADQAAELFASKGIKTQVCLSSRTTEAGKLWDTTQYGVMILLEKEIHKFCKENDLDVDTIYRHFNGTYNEGYLELGMGHVVRPSLFHIDGPIGGHCVVQNAALLDTPTADRIIQENTQL